MTYRIMCAYHLSAIGDKAFEFALRLARQADGELFVVSVFQPSEEARDSEPAALMQAANQEFDSAFDRLRMQAAQLARPAHFDISVGYPAVHVLSEAARLSIEHIVLGAEGKRLTMGSAEHRIAMMAQCAVTLVR
jgi:nucleotide-binding universal stress UspA family protein